MFKLTRIPLLAILVVLMVVTSTQAQTQLPSRIAFDQATAVSTDSTIATAVSTDSTSSAIGTQTPLPGVPNSSPEGQPLPDSILVTPRKGICRRTCVRKEVSNLSQAEWERFANALRQLNRGQGGSRLTPFERLVDEHMAEASKTHGTDMFFPWHRYYLARLEQTLQAIDPEICLPYWDWSRNSQNYVAHPVFQPNRMGAPQPGCIKSSSFPNWNTRQSGGECVRRTFTQNTLTAVQFIVGIMRGSPNYSEFRPRYESQCHGAPHVALGGVMSTMASPSDPIFWLHHSLVDKHLSDYFESFKGGKFNNANEVMPIWSLNVRDMEHTRDWCYVYDNSPFHDEVNPKAPDGLPESWLKMSFGDDPNVISKVTGTTSQILNKVEDKISRNDTSDLFIPKRDINVISPPNFNNPPSRHNSAHVITVSSLMSAVMAIVYIAIGL